MESSKRATRQVAAWCSRVWGQSRSMLAYVSRKPESKPSGVYIEDLDKLPSPQFQQLPSVRPRPRCKVRLKLTKHSEYP